MTAGVVSVVVPCYRQAGFVGRAIETALDQAGAPMEVVLVDDESPDDTPAVAAGFGDRIRYVRQPNGGVAHARNTGLSVATGEFVVFLDADDYLLPGMVEHHLAVMRDAAADVTAGGWRGVDRDGVTAYSLPAPAFGDDPFHALLVHNLNPPVCNLFRRSAVDRVGGYDPDRALNGHEDWDLLLRLALAGSRFASVPGEWSAYRQYAGTSSKQAMRMYDTGMRTLAKTERAHPPCAACGDRYRRGRNVLRKDYFYGVLGPERPPGRSAAEWGTVARHFASRTVRDPLLAAMVAKLAVRRGFR